MFTTSLPYSPGRGSRAVLPRRRKKLLLRSRRLWKVALRPGRPLMHGRLGAMHVLGLPGNPVSAYVCGVLFFLPLMRRLAGRSDLALPREAAVLGSRMRFRAVMMTSFAFILGVYPLVTAQGAAELSRHAVGTPVFAGMIAASAIGLFVIPMLYVTFQAIRERSSERVRRLRPRPAETN